MSYFENDYIKRLIKQLAAFVARIGKANTAKDRDAAQRLIDNASSEILGLEFHALNSVDVSSAVMLLKDPEKVRMYADLLEAEAQMLDTHSDPARAQLRRDRAVALLTRAGDMR